MSRMPQPTAKWTEPPTNDSQLVWRFNVADAECGIGAQNYEGGSSGGTARRPDDRMVGRLVHEPGAGFRHNDMTCPLPDFLRGTRVVGRRPVGGTYDDERPAARLKRIDTVLAKLTPATRETLWWAYGPNRANREGELVAKLGQWWGVALNGASAAKAFGEHRQELIERYSGTRAIASVCHVTTKTMREIISMDAYLAASADTQAALEGRMKWLLHEAPKDLLATIRNEADGEVYDAWNRWADARGRKRHVERWGSREEMLDALGIGTR